MSTNEAPIKNHRFYNKAQIARELGVSRVYVSLLMRGRVKNSGRLKQVKEIIKSMSQAA